MQGEASKIIRTIRQGLDMSQADFARALGWGTSTISRWESGKAEPNRLAMKIILAFGEERGIRYRPRTKALPAPTRNAPLLPAIPMPIALPDDEPAWTASLGSDGPAWEAHLNLRLALDRGTGSAPGSRRSWFHRAAAGGAMCTALFLGVVMLTATPARDVGGKRAPSRRPAPDAWTAAPAAAVPQPEHPREGSRRGRRVRRPTPPIIEAETPSAPLVVPAPPSPPVLARLEGVTLLGAVRKATFRTDVDSITVVEGEQLGAHQAVRVGGEGVELRDAAGSVLNVKLGDVVAVR
jgi:transcriptional regulator with XRE-family HTH domain